MGGVTVEPEKIDEDLGKLTQILLQKHPELQPKIEENAAFLRKIVEANILMHNSAYEKYGNPITVRLREEALYQILYAFSTGKLPKEEAGRIVKCDMDYFLRSYCFDVASKHEEQ